MNDLDNKEYDLENNGAQTCQYLMELQRAADYFGFPKLYRIISSLIVSQIQNDPTLSWQFLDDNCNDAEVKTEARKFIRNNFKETIFVCFFSKFLKYVKKA